MREGDSDDVDVEGGRWYIVFVGWGGSSVDYSSLLSRNGRCAPPLLLILSGLRPSRRT